MDRDGLVLGAGTVLAKHCSTHSAGRALDLSGQEDRILLLLSIAFQRRIPAAVMGNIRRAADAFVRGEKATAHMHLAFSGLHALEDERAAPFRLFLADRLLAKGITPRQLVSALAVEPNPVRFFKSDADESDVDSGGDSAGSTDVGDLPSSDDVASSSGAVDDGVDGWNPAEHPRAGVPPNPGWFATVDHEPVDRDKSDDDDQRSRLDIIAPTPVQDFSGGFHDAVVDQWMAAFEDNGIPAVETPAIRVIGPNSSVVGYPDMITHEPGQPIEVWEVKTGDDPTFTANQAAYIPALQYGGHIYSLDPRITALGLQPGVPLPPVRVYVIVAPGPNQQYKIIPLNPPTIIP